MIYRKALKPFDSGSNLPIACLQVNLDVEGRGWAHVEFRAQEASAELAVPDLIPVGGRTDRLWEHTCFEVFARLSDGSYAEFNLSPSSQWAAYRFDGYRIGMSELDGGVRIQRINRAQDCLTIEAILDWQGWPQVSAAGISAVIEATDGSKSYWALAHPSDKPDFHHPGSFVLDLP